MKNVKKFVSLAIGAAMTLGSLLPVNAGMMSVNKVYVSHFVHLTRRRTRTERKQREHMLMLRSERERSS